MFTGIIETLGTIKALTKQLDNVQITIESAITKELKVDQSVAHNGVCLTVIEINNDCYTVTAIQETILKTNLSGWTENTLVNLERAMKLGDRLDGHIVQGHVDGTAICTKIITENGSWRYTFEFDENGTSTTIEKGSITVNGVSLTVVDSKKNSFSVAIIPYTYENTTFKDLVLGSKVNLEFDVIGKYVARLMELRK